MQERKIDWKALSAPFPTEDVEWRVQSCGRATNGLWALVVPYVTCRAIMERLDAVVGPENWKNRFDEGPAGGTICGISIRVNGEWVEKWDGADKTQIEEIKGALSGAMKRAGTQWGIGRYFYRVDPVFAKIHERGRHMGRTKDGSNFRWDPPGLPEWALPEDHRGRSPGQRTAPASCAENDTQVVASPPQEPSPPAEGALCMSLEEAKAALDRQESASAMTGWMSANRALLKPIMKELSKYYNQRMKEYRDAAA